MAEFDGARFATMLTANPDLQRGANAPTGGHGKSNQLAYTVPIEYLERIVRKYTTVDVSGEKAARVIATEPKRRLR